MRVRFEQPRLKLGPVTMGFGPSSEVELATTYLDERVRLGKGSRGSVFVFVRGGNQADERAGLVGQLYGRRALGLRAVLALFLAVVAGSVWMSMFALRATPLNALAVPFSITVVSLAALLAAVLFNGGIVQGDQDKNIPKAA